MTKEVGNGQAKLLMMISSNQKTSQSEQKERKTKKINKERLAANATEKEIKCFVL